MEKSNLFNKHLYFLHLPKILFTGFLIFLSFIYAAETIDFDSINDRPVSLGPYAFREINELFIVNLPENTEIPVVVSMKAPIGISAEIDVFYQRKDGRWNPYKSLNLWRNGYTVDEIVLGPLSDQFNGKMVLVPRGLYSDDVEFMLRFNQSASFEIEGPARVNPVNQTYSYRSYVQFTDGTRRDVTANSFWTANIQATPGRTMYMSIWGDPDSGTLFLPPYEALDSNNFDVSFGLNRIAAVMPVEIRAASTEPSPDPGGMGEVSFILVWGYDSDDQGPDIDLHVVDPDGKHIYFGNKLGHFDMDDRGASGPGDGGGPERAHWSPALVGDYTYFAHWYDNVSDASYANGKIYVYRKLNGEQILQTTRSFTVSATDRESHQWVFTVDPVESVVMPIINAHPADVTVNERTGAIFTVTVTSETSPVYQWQRSVDNGVNWENIENATASSYQTGPTNADMNSHQFRVKVGNTAGNVLSQVATLSIIPSGQTEPSYVDQQYYLHGKASWSNEDFVHINIQGAWETSKGSPSIGIGVIDSGFWPAHPDLPENYGGWDYVTNNPISEKAYLEKVGGNNLFLSNHGVTVSGIISAQHNDFGVKGIAPECSIRYFNLGRGTDETVNVAAAINKARELDCRVITVSIAPLGLIQGSGLQKLRESVQAALDEGRTVLIPASANVDIQAQIDQMHAIDFISRLPGVIVVGGLTMRGEAHHTDSGNGFPSPLMDVSAPSEWIVTTDLPAPYGRVTETLPLEPPYSLIINTLGDENRDKINGTSFATPMVAAVVGLMYSVNPDLTPVEVEMILRETANPDMLPDFDGDVSGHDPRFGYGVVDAAAAVKRAERMRSLQRGNYGHIREIATNRFLSEIFGLLEFANHGADDRLAFSHSLQTPVVDQVGGIFSALYGRLTPNSWNIPFWVVSEFFGLVHFGQNAEQYAGWVNSERFGWMRFVDAGDGNRFLWVQRLQTWMSVNPDGSFHSFDFGWLVPEPGSLNRYNSRIGILIDDELNPDGWLRSDRFGFVWFARDGTGTWFWSSIRNEWIGITPQGGLWSTAEGRFLP
jgi:hypothetical protein